jgi:hypothetical protein
MNAQILEIRNRQGEVKRTVEIVGNIEDATNLVSTFNEFSFTHFAFGEVEDQIQNARYFFDEVEIPNPRTI